MLIVWSRADRVEADLVGGRLACPGCGGRLGPWGHARWRVLRGVDRSEGFAPRRTRCGSCRSTQVLLPDVCLARRRGPVAVIGSALSLNVSGIGWRRVAARLGVPAWTVRGWVRRFKAAAGAIRAHFTVWAYALDAVLTPIAPAGSAMGDALEAVGVAARAASLRFGPRPAWSWAASMTGGWLLATRVQLWPAP